MSKLSASYRFNSPLLFSPSGKRSSFDAAYHRFLLLGIFPRSIPRGNAIRSRTPLSYIFIRSRKQDNAKGNIETFGGSFDTQEENDVVRIYNDSTYSPPKYASYTQHELVCGNKRMLMRSLIIFPFFDEPFFSNNDFTICREKKKEKHTRARTGR